MARRRRTISSIFSRFNRCPCFYEMLVVMIYIPDHSDFGISSDLVVGDPSYALLSSTSFRQNFCSARPLFSFRRLKQTSARFYPHSPAFTSSDLLSTRPSNRHPLTETPVDAPSIACMCDFRPRLYILAIRIASSISGLLPEEIVTSFLCATANSSASLAIPTFEAPSRCSFDDFSFPVSLTGELLESGSHRRASVMINLGQNFRSEMQRIRWVWAWPIRFLIWVVCGPLRFVGLNQICFSQQVISMWACIINSEIWASSDTTSLFLLKSVRTESWTFSGPKISNSSKAICYPFVLISSLKEIYFTNIFSSVERVFPLGPPVCISEVKFTLEISSLWERLVSYTSFFMKRLNLKFSSFMESVERILTPSSSSSCMKNLLNNFHFLHEKLPSAILFKVEVSRRIFIRTDPIRTEFQLSPLTTSFLVGEFQISPPSMSSLVGDKRQQFFVLCSFFVQWIARKFSRPTCDHPFQGPSAPAFQAQVRNLSKTAENINLLGWQFNVGWTEILQRFSTSHSKKPFSGSDFTISRALKPFYLSHFHNLYFCCRNVWVIFYSMKRSRDPYLSLVSLSVFRLALPSGELYLPKI